MPDMIPHETPLQSKRFTAFLVSELSATLLILVLLLVHREAVSPFVWAGLLVLVLVKGFIEALYLGGQASLDSYVRLAQIAAAAGVKLEHKALTIHASEDEDAEPAPAPAAPPGAPT